MIVRSRIVVPMVGEPLENAAVATRGNIVVSVGSFHQVKKAHPGDDIIDLGDRILLPGLINAHCHLDYTMLRGRIPAQRTFTDWICAINALKAGLSESDYVRAIDSGLAEAQAFGTTTIVNLEAFPGILPSIGTPLLRVWWCAEMIDVRTRVSPEELWELLRQWFRSRPHLLGGLGLAPHALYTASRQLFDESSAIRERHDLLLTTHLAESREEMQMFRDANGSLFDFLREIGRPIDDCGNATPISTLIRHGLMNDRWIVAHLNEIAEEDFDLLEQCNRFHIVHCPTSHDFFGHAPFALRRLEAIGFNVCLGTDSLASNSSLSLFAEMQRLIEGKHSITPRQALTMAAINGAKAIGQAESLGQIRPGFTADLIAIPYGGHDDPYEAIIGFDGKVPWMMVNGSAQSID
jgi:aminodeoxyfutalosine deaminase